MATVKDIQQRLKAAGLFDGDVDGVLGPVTLAAITAALDKFHIAPVAVAPPQPRPTTDTVPIEWMPKCKMDRVIFHWTAGNHKASEFDRGHYHILIEDDGKLIRGIPVISGNAAASPVGKKASHTLNCNTGSIGVSLCCMAGAVESPFNAGSDPLTREQWEKASSVIADLCRQYQIPVTPRTVLSHAEVQANLGITQRQKWDIAILPFDQEFNTARECGDRMRHEVIAKLSSG